MPSRRAWSDIVISNKAEPIFVTGGTGRTGAHLVRALVERGYPVRAVTSGKPPAQRGVEWRQMDWHQNINFDAMVEGCSAVLHLGAELSDIPKMHRANVEATEALVASAERAKVKFFCYTSTISVYGSPRKRLITEDEPVVTTEYDARHEYLAEDFFRAYARTKLLAEKHIHAGAKTSEYVIFRPTVIVDIGDVLSVRNWSQARRFLFAYRHSHQIYVADVVHAIIWFMEHALTRDRIEPGVKVYNLSNDDIDYNTYGYFFRKAYKATGDKRFFCPLYAPGLFDMISAIAKYRSHELRYPLGMLRFSTDKLYATGYRHAFGVLEAHDRAIRGALNAADRQRRRESGYR